MNFDRPQHRRADGLQGPGAFGPGAGYAGRGGYGGYPGYMPPPGPYQQIRDQYRGTGMPMPYALKKGPRPDGRP